MPTSYVYLFPRYLCLFCLLSHGVISAQTQSNLIAHYNFNNNYNDVSSYKNHGSSKGAISFVEDRFGNQCSALGLNGSAFVQVPSSRSLNSPKKELTIMAWIKSDFGGINQPDLMWFTICSKGNSSTETSTVPHYRLQMTSKTISLNTEFTENLNQYISPSTWYHCTMVYTGNQVLLYLNADLIFNFHYTSKQQSNNEPLEIGRDVPGKEEYHYGAIDDLRIYNRALSLTRIQTIYNDLSEQGMGNSNCPNTPKKTPVIVNTLDTIYQNKTVYVDKIDTLYRNKTITVDKLDTLYQNKTVYLDKQDTVYRRKEVVKYQIDTVYKDKVIYINRPDTVYKTGKRIDISKDAFVLKHVYFRKSRPELLSTSHDELNELALTLNENPSISIRLEGHTDNVGDANKNFLLSSKRVKVVKNYLVNRGIQESRITVKAFGETKPLNDNSTEELRKLNRRVEVKVTKR